MKKVLSIFTLCLFLVGSLLAQTQTEKAAPKKSKKKEKTTAKATKVETKVAPVTKVQEVKPASSVVKAAETKTTTPAAPTKTDGPQMTLSSMEVDYGTIEQGSDPFREFKFKNTGKAPLIITSAQGSCGCTVPEFPKEPIMPGESNVIKVRYDTSRVGKFTKTVTLSTNEGEEKKVLRISGDVLKKEEPKSVPSSTPSIFGGNQN